MSPEEKAAWDQLLKIALAHGWLKFHHAGVLVIVRPEPPSLPALPVG